MKCSPNVTASQELYLTIEKQILKDLAEEIHSAVKSISLQPVTMSLVPIKDALASLHGVARTLEKISK